MVVDSNEYWFCCSGMLVVVHSGPCSHQGIGKPVRSIYEERQITTAAGESHYELLCGSQVLGEICFAPRVGGYPPSQTTIHGYEPS